MARAVGDFGEVVVLRRDFALSALVAAPGVFADREAHAQTADVAIAGPLVIIGPDIRLYARTASGDLEIREDWSGPARDHVRNALEERFRASARSCQFADQTAAMEGRSGQVLRLHAIVSAAALNAQRHDERRAGASSRWTVGVGAREIADTYGADHALIVEGAGAYASAARNVMARVSDVQGLASAAAGNIYSAARLVLRGFRQDGKSYIRASLVELESGDIVWIREVDADDDDPRTSKGAKRLVDALLEHAPL
jgi:hypothetical protein